MLPGEDFCLPSSCTTRNMERNDESNSFTRTHSKGCQKTTNSNLNLTLEDSSKFINVDQHSKQVGILLSQQALQKRIKRLQQQIKGNKDEMNLSGHSNMMMTPKHQHKSLDLMKEPLTQNQPFEVPFDNDQSKSIESSLISMEREDISSHFRQNIANHSKNIKSRKQTLFEEMRKESISKRKEYSRSPSQIQRRRSISNIPFTSITRSRSRSSCRTNQEGDNVISARMQKHRRSNSSDPSNRKSHSIERRTSKSNKDEWSLLLKSSKERQKMRSISPKPSKPRWKSRSMSPRNIRTISVSSVEEQEEGLLYSTEHNPIKQGYSIDVMVASLSASGTYKSGDTTLSLLKEKQRQGVDLRSILASPPDGMRNMSNRSYGDRSQRSRRSRSIQSLGGSHHRRRGKRGSGQRRKSIDNSMERIIHGLNQRSESSGQDVQ